MDLSSKSWYTSYTVGNQLFSQGQYEDAEESYSVGIISIDEDLNCNNSEDVIQYHIKLLLNRAQCRLYTRDNEVIQYYT